MDNTIPVSELSEAARRDENTRAFVDSLRERGWTEGKNLEILWRSADGNPDRRPAIFQELVRNRVDAIVVFGDYATRDALRATRTIPVVMVSSSAPLREGHIASLARPGANVAQSRIRGLIERHRMPVVQASMTTRLGAILNYGGDVRASHVSAAGYVDRILRGSRPGDLPIEQPRAFQLWVNKRAARAIGLEIPDSLVLLADRVIE